MSINWGGYNFEKINPLDIWDPPLYGGIYTITYKKDPTNDPKTHTLLYIGETGNFSNRFKSHEKYNDWKDHSNQANLHVSIHIDMIEKSRQAKEKDLIKRLKPKCNDEYA